jgi:hypothetical protein
MQTDRNKKDSRVQECLDHAEYCEQRAATALDRLAKRTFIEAARCWRELAVSYSQLGVLPAFFPEIIKRTH